MTIYEIDQQIQSLIDGGVDPETGELLIDEEALQALQLARETKVENLALAVKNLVAEAKAIKAEEDALAKRRRTAEAKAERARQYLDFLLAGEKFKTPRVAVSYRSAVKTEISPEFLTWAMVSEPDLLRYKDPEPDRAAVKAALESGRELPGAALVESRSMTIK